MHSLLEPGLRETIIFLNKVVGFGLCLNNLYGASRKSLYDASSSNHKLSQFLHHS